MKLPAKDWRKYVESLSKINETAARKMQEYIDIKGTENTDELVAYAHALATKYGEASGALACEMYDSVAEMSGANVPAAQMAQTATYGETAKAIYGTMLNQNNPVPQTVGRLVKQVAADTTLQNGLRDGAKFAWIPHGDTCAFCLMLASRGWQRVSKRALRNGHAEHIHPNCDCEYAISFDANPQVGGYDPDYYRRIYDGAEGDTARQKINYLRREQYAASKIENLVNKDGVKIQFEDAIKNGDKYKTIRKLIQDLTKEYETRLETVGTGAERAAGDVNISGAKMRLNTSQEASALHEFAHTLASSNADKYGLTNDKEFWKEIRKVYREYHKDVDAAQDVKRWISSYEHSSRDIDEFMAEAFAHAKAREKGIAVPSKYGNDYTYSQKVLQIIDKYFKR